MKSGKRRHEADDSFGSDDDSDEDYGLKFETVNDDELQVPNSNQLKLLNISVDKTPKTPESNELGADDFAIPYVPKNDYITDMQEKLKSTPVQPVTKPIE